MGRHLLLGTGLNVLGGIVGQGFTFVTLVIALSRVGAEAYGIVALALSVTQLPLLLEKGMGIYVLSAVNAPHTDERRGARLAVSAASYMGLGLATLLVGLFVSHGLLDAIIEVSPHLKFSAIRAFDLLAVAAAVRAVFAFTARSLVAESRLPTLRVIELSRDAAGLVFTVLLVGHGARNVIWVALAVLISDLVAAGVAAAVARSTWREALHPGSIDADVREEFLHACKPYLAIVASGAMVSRADPFVIGVVLGPSALALHAVALRLFQLYSGAIDLLCLGVMSGTARLRASGESQRVGGLYRKASRYAALVIWPMAILAIAYAGRVAERFGEFQQGEFVGVLRSVMLLVLLTVPVSEAWAVVFGANDVSGLVRRQWVVTMASFVLTVALAKPLGVPAAFVGSMAGTLGAGLFLLPAVGRLSGQSVGKLLSGLIRPGFLAVGLFVALVVFRSFAPNIATELVLVTAALALYGVLGLFWAVLTEDRQRVFAGLARG